MTLEDALKSDKRSPYEVAAAVTQFIHYELPAGGVSAETRFLRLFPLLCTRIFGPLLDGKGGYKHGEGGWMNAPSLSSQRPSTTLTGAGTRSRSLPSTASTPQSKQSLSVHMLLGAAYETGKEDPFPTLVDAISKESANRPTAGFPFPLFALPKSCCDAWMAVLDSELSRITAPPMDICSPQTYRLLTEILRRAPLEQPDLLAHKQSLAEKNDSSTPFMELSPRNYPMNSPQASVSPRAEKKPSEPNVVLGMLEYYLFLFVRYPLAKPVQKVAVSSPGVTVHRVNSAVRRRTDVNDAMYNYLFERYLKHFLNTEKPKFAPLSRESLLFLHVIVSLWFESQGRCQTTEMVVDRRFGSNASSLNLSNSFDLVHVKYDPPYKQVQKCILLLVRHLMVDPSIEVRQGQSYVLPLAMDILQLPLFNFIRASFRHAGIHDSESPFYTALDVWLMILEPWNVKEANSEKNAAQRLVGNSPRSTKTTPRRTLSLVQKNAKSRYSDRWEAYVAANIHFYTVPLAIFLRRARELDFSGHRFHRSLAIVQRVFRVYTREVVDCLDRIMSNGASEYALQVQKHLQRLSSYAPPSCESMTLSSCQDDMKYLLEEVSLQHQKSTAQHSFIENWFASPLSGEVKEIRALVVRARIIVKLPADYQIDLTPGTPSRKTSPVLDRPRLVDSSGRLTEDALYDIYDGKVKCDPADVLYDGDIMNRRLGTNEIQFLVDFFVALSENLHERTGYEIDLRFWADWHHLRAAVAILIVGYMLCKLFF